MGLVDTTKPLKKEVKLTKTDLFSVINSSSAKTSSSETKAPVKNKSEVVEDDPFADEDDLFADDGGEAAAALQTKLRKEAEERAARKMKNAKSMIVLEVKPFDADTDLESLALNIKKLTHEGIQNWGQEHKLEKIAFGIKKLIISVIVFDAKIGVDDITDLIMEKYEEEVQSVDVHSMSKV